MLQMFSALRTGHSAGNGGTWFKVDRSKMFASPAGTSPPPGFGEHAPGDPERPAHHLRSRPAYWPACLVSHAAARTAALDAAAKNGIGLDKVRAHSRHAVIGALLIYADEHDREGTHRTRWPRIPL